MSVPGRKCPTCGAVLRYNAPACTSCGESFALGGGLNRFAKGFGAAREKRLRRITYAVLGAVVAIPLLVWLFVALPIRSDLRAAARAVEAKGCPDLDFRIPLFPLSMPEVVEIGGGIDRSVVVWSASRSGSATRYEVPVRGVVNGTYDVAKGEVVAEAPLRKGVANAGIMKAHFHINRDAHGHVTDASGEEIFNVN